MSYRIPTPALRPRRNPRALLMAVLPIVAALLCALLACRIGAPRQKEASPTDLRLKSESVIAFLWLAYAE